MYEHVGKPDSMHWLITHDFPHVTTMATTGGQFRHFQSHPKIRFLLRFHPIFPPLSLSQYIYIYTIVYIYIFMNKLYNIMSPSYPHYVPNAIKSPWFNLPISIHASMILESLEGQQLRPAKPKTLAILLVSQHFTPGVDIHQMRRRF